MLATGPLHFTEFTGATVCCPAEGHFIQGYSEINVRTLCYSSVHQAYGYQQRTQTGLCASMLRLTGRKRVHNVIKSSTDPTGGDSLAPDPEAQPSWKRSSMLLRRSRVQGTL
jgi:hypothetical protein